MPPGRHATMAAHEYYMHLRRHLMYQNEKRTYYLRVMTQGGDGIECEIHDPSLRPSLILRADSYEDKIRMMHGKIHMGRKISRQDAWMTGEALAARMYPLGIMEVTMQRWKKQRWGSRHWMIVKILQLHAIKVHTAPVHQFNDDPVW